MNPSSSAAVCRLPGRRHTAEELLGFMGYEGFDPAILWAEIAEVLRTV